MWTCLFACLEGCSPTESCTFQYLITDSLPTLLPCEACRTHLKDYLQTTPFPSPPQKDQSSSENITTHFLNWKKNVTTWLQNLRTVIRDKNNAIMNTSSPLSSSPYNDTQLPPIPNSNFVYTTNNIQKNAMMMSKKVPMMMMINSSSSSLSSSIPQETKISQHHLTSNNTPSLTTNNRHHHPFLPIKTQQTQNKYNTPIISPTITPIINNDNNIATRHINPYKNIPLLSPSFSSCCSRNKYK